ncbi:MAG: WG repeat-containing protein [Candidatus Gastranaerophilales bacterium]|nr:WG repeat-containing protein [Candidatus Gastranaerophilales bacterium]
MKKSLDVWQVEDFSEIGLAKIITTDDKHYWVDTSGKVVSEQAAHVLIAGNYEKYALVNKAGEIVVPYGVYNNLDFSIMENQYGTAFVVEKEGSIGLIDDKGKEIVQFGYYDHIIQSCYIGLHEGYILPYEFGKNTYFVAKDGFGRLINDKGERIYDKRCHTAEELLMQFAVPATYIPYLTPKRDDGMYGYVNQQNELIIPYKFMYAREFENGFAKVSDSKNIEDIDECKWYHIDETGKKLHYTIEYNETEK